MPNIHLSASVGWSSEMSSIFCHTRKMRLLLLWLLAFSIAPAQVRAAQKLRVAFPSLATALSPSWITAERGLWQKYGLDVELIYLDGGSRSVSALIGGSAQLIFGSDVLVTVANLQGANLIRLGVTTNTLGYALVTAPGIKTMADLKGKTLGVTMGRDAAYARLSKILHEKWYRSENRCEIVTRRRWPERPCGGNADRAHSRDHADAADGFGGIKSRHENPVAYRCAVDCGRNQCDGAVSAKKSPYGDEFSQGLHRRYSIFKGE